MLRGGSSRLALVGALACVLIAVDCVAAATALGAPAPGLPRTYTVQRVDAPQPAVGGRIGAGMVNVGDTNNDGEDDFVTVQTAGTANGNNGAIYVLSGETGTLIRTANMPDPGNTVAGSLDMSIFDPNVDRLNDVGSCVGGQAGVTCGTNPIGPPDGVHEILVGAQGVDVGGQRDVGRAYVFDGATLAVLKRIDMPAADIAIQTAIIAAQSPTLSNLRAGGFGRTVQSPRGLPPCEGSGNGGVGDCPAVSNVFPGVSAASRIGDMDGGGRGEIVVGANRFHETAMSAYPTSQCATSMSTFCFEAGRTYIYRGEDVAGSDPAVNLDVPLTTLKNPAAQSLAPKDSGIAPNTEIENFGHVQIPVGDVGQCRSGGAFPVATPNDPCLPTSSTNAADGFPELVVASHRADIPISNPEPTWFDVGVIFLIDGATRSILHTYEHPEPQPGSAFGFTLHTPFPFGDMGPNVAADNPDFLAAAFIQTVGNVTGAGRAYLMNGNFKGGPNAYSFGALNDPTPTVGGNFGTAGSALGDLVPAERKAEVIVGGFASARARDDAITDLNVFNTFYEKRLQQIQDPDQQPNSKFGSRVAPLGDLNEDGFLDFVAAADGWDTPGGVDNNNGRMYIFRSDNSPAPVAPNPPSNNPAPSNPAPTPPATTPPADVGAVTPVTPTPVPVAATRAGRRISLRASDTRISRSDSVRLTGTIRELVNNSGCRSRQRVSIQRSTSADGPYRTFRRVTTTQNGTFRLTLEPTRTYRYRALVSVTGTCLRAASSSVRVRLPSRRSR